MAKIIQTGHSLAVTIPKKFAKSMGLSKGDDVKIEKHPQKGELILKFIGARQLVISSAVLKEKNA